MINSRRNFRIARRCFSSEAEFRSKAETYAKAFAGSGYHIITGAGNVWPEAFYYGMCILEEMQWIRTRPVHASDFFHGTLELVEKDVSVILFKGEDDCRPLAERVQNFVPNYTSKLTVLDTAEFELPASPPRCARLSRRYCSQRSSSASAPTSRSCAIIP